MDGGSRDCILIFRLGSIGDTVVALPCFHAIARAYPQYRRVLLTNAVTSVRASSAESVLKGTGLIDEVIHYPSGGLTVKNAAALIGQLRHLGAACMIYLAERTGALPVYRDFVFFKAAGIPKILCAPLRRAQRRCRIDPSTGELEYEAERLARMLAPAVSVSLARPNWDLHFTEMETAKVSDVLQKTLASHPLLAIAPATKIAAKAWGSDKWSALMRTLAAELSGAALVVVGAADERTIGAQVARHWAGPVLNLCGMQTPREMAAVLRHCALMVCHDSGPMHMAAAQGTPCVALFGNHNRPRQWFPYGTGHRIIHEPRGMRAISVARVAGHVRRAFADVARGAPQIINPRHA